MCARVDTHRGRVAVMLVCCRCLPSARAVAAASCFTVAIVPTGNPRPSADAGGADKAADAGQRSQCSGRWRARGEEPSHRAPAMPCRPFLAGGFAFGFGIPGPESCCCCCCCCRCHCCCRCRWWWRPLVWCGFFASPSRLLVLTWPSLSSCRPALRAEHVH